MRATRLLPATRLGRILLLGIVSITVASMTVMLTLPGSTSHAARMAAPAASNESSTGSVANPNALPFSSGTATSGRVIVVLKNQHSNLDLIKQATARRATDFKDQAPIVSSIKASGGSDVLQLVAVNAVAAKLSSSKVSRLLKMPSVSRIVPDSPVTNQASPAVASPAASVPNSQVVPPANPAPCPATSTGAAGRRTGARGRHRRPRLGRQSERSRHGQLDRDRQGRGRGQRGHQRHPGQSELRASGRHAGGRQRAATGHHDPGRQRRVRRGRVLDRRPGHGRVPVRHGPDDGPTRRAALLRPALDLQVLHHRRPPRARR